MTDYYCHACATTKGLAAVNVPADLTGSNYQVGKFFKHTSPDPAIPVQTVLNLPDYDDYKDLMINTAASGSVEVDQQGRRNLILWVGHQTGLLYEAGVLKAPVDAFKLVIPGDASKIHGYPTGSVGFAVSTCHDCGKLVGC